MTSATITEGSAMITASAGPLSSRLPVFYNPAMKFNRDISVILLNSLQRSGLSIADPLAGSGVRAIRFLKELPQRKIKAIAINDHSPAALAAIKKSIQQNNLANDGRITLHNKDASLFLLESDGFDYIDIDPFGSPNPFLDAALKRIARHGILAITATDTAALAGTAPKACKRKYWATPLRNELMHEIGLRILIRKAQLIAAQYHKALAPLFSYAKEHYYRVFFHSVKSKAACDQLLRQHRLFYYCSTCIAHGTQPRCTHHTLQTAGPLWIGPLFDKRLVSTMLTNSSGEETELFLTIANEESARNIIGFYDLHTLSKKTKEAIPKTEDAIRKLRNNGFIALPTHFSAHAVKTDASPEELTQSLSAHP